MLWQTAQLVPLNAGPSPSSLASTSRKSSRPRRNSWNSTGVRPASGVPSALRVCALDNTVMNTAAAIPINKYVFMVLCSFSNQSAPHERMTRPAELRAFEHVASSLRRRERDGCDAFAALRNRHVDVGADDAKTMVGVIAAQANLDGCAGLDAKFRRRKAETLDEDFNDLGFLLNGGGHRCIGGCRENG